MVDLIDIDGEINSPATGDEEVMVEVEMLVGDPQEADYSQIGKKRISNEKPPLPKKAKRCPPKADPNSAMGVGGRRRAEVWNHVTESPNSTPTEPRALYAMKLKFQKYWGDFDGINGLVYVAILLDPRYKIQYIKYSFGVIYGERMGNLYAEKVEGILHSLYEQYSSRHAMRQTSSSVGSSSTKSNLVGEKGENIDRNDDDEDDVRSKWERLVFEEHNSDHNNEVVRYLGEATEVCKTAHFDILNWWKTNASRYPIISQIARHVLAIPVSTVASESAFSTGGRILDPYRSSLAPTTLEALICTQNWLRSTPSLYDLKQIGFMIDVFDDDAEYASGTPPPPPSSDTQQSSNSLC